MLNELNSLEAKYTVVSNDRRVELMRYEPMIHRVMPTLDN